jgi:hypothetical protein
MGTFVLDGDLALLIVAAGGLFATLLAIVQDTRHRRESAGMA